MAAVREAFESSTFIYRLWEEPSFHDWHCWTVSVDRRVRRLTWCIEDLERFTNPIVGLQSMFSPQPTLLESQGVCSQATWELLEGLPQTIFPQPDPNLAHLDGCRFGVAWQKGEEGSRYEWWDACRPTLKAWETCVDRLESDLA